MNYIKKGQDHIWLPYTQMQNHLKQLNVKKTRGSKIYLSNNQILIDGISSWWSIAHGYNHPHIKKSIKSQLNKLPHIMLAGFANEQTYKLAYRLCQFSNMDKCFFSDSGSTAIEVAMKMSWQFYLNHNIKTKTKFISFKNSYHGDSSGAMSLADLSTGMHFKFSKLLLQNYSLNLPTNQNELNKFEEFVKNKHNNIAGLFIEPMVQCAGGMKFHNVEILEQIYLIVKKYNILFICDECAVGFYRTGKKFAFMHSKIIEPDILTIGKALTGGVMTLAATMTNNNIYNAFLGNNLDLALMHGPTFMGNPLACSAANASLDLFERNNYEKSSLRNHQILIDSLKKFKKYKDVTDIRVIGNIGVIEFKKDWSQILKMREQVINYNVFLRPLSNCLYIMPPLNITIKDLEKIIDACDQLLTSTI